jgi:hypothetical protein
VVCWNGAGDGVYIGTYSIKVKLDRDLSQLAPIMGKTLIFYLKKHTKSLSKLFLAPPQEGFVIPRR